MQVLTLATGQTTTRHGSLTKGHNHMLGMVYLRAPFDRSIYNLGNTFQRRTRGLAGFEVLQLRCMWWMRTLMCGCLTFMDNCKTIIDHVSSLFLTKHCRSHLRFWEPCLFIRCDTRQSISSSSSNAFWDNRTDLCTKQNRGTQSELWDSLHAQSWTITHAQREVQRLLEEGD